MLHLLRLVAASRDGIRWDGGLELREFGPVAASSSGAPSALSSCGTFRAPTTGTMLGLLASTQAMASAAGVTLRLRARPLQTLDEAAIVYAVFS